MRQSVVDRLTKAYDFIIKEKNETGVIENPLVVSQLSSEDRTIHAYLIAKDPDKDIFYGLLEGPFEHSKKEIAGIPLNNLKALYNSSSDRNHHPLGLGMSAKKMSQFETLRDCRFCRICRVAGRLR